MVIQRSRKWVKDRIPAFICRETNWWAARWIQCNIFLCPECRKEYRSLKSVWESLDRWNVDEPGEELETGFVENFRKKYPSAYETEDPQTASPGYWIPRVVYLCVLAVLGFAILSQPQVKRTAVRTVKAPFSDIEISPKETVSEAPDAAETQVAVGPNPGDRSPDRGKTDLLSPWAPSSRNLPTRGTRFRTTSTIEPAPYSQTFRTPLRGRTIEINNMPVSGFESLTRPYEAERPY